MTNNVLIFGPTGGVGRAVALTAGKQSGTKVWLAMRDTSKPIPGFDESSGDFSRVQADLSKPDSLTSAVQQSGATSAFVYAIMESTDSMKAAFQALKAAGITYVVFLSSVSVQGDAHDEANFRHFIPRAHAQIEIALEESGIPFTAVRPAAFATNVLWNKPGIIKGEVEVLNPEGKLDYISPDDIGRVAGLILVKGQASKPIPLMGPKLYTAHEAYDVIGKALGKEVKVKSITAEQFHQNMHFLPQPVRQSIVDGTNEGFSMFADHEQVVGNILQYGGGIEPTEFPDWVEAHKAELAA